MKVSTVIFDFGGVIAEEGWAKGVRIIAAKCGHEPESFFELCVQAIHDTGFCLGKVDEYGYWTHVKTLINLPMSATELKNEILPRFVVRPYVIEMAENLGRKYRTAILSDQTHWLDELNERDGFFKSFQHVFNSYHDGNSKQSPSYFTETCNKLNIFPQEAVFIDDNKGNIARALGVGMNAVLYETFEQTADELKKYVEI
ncbi:HAD family phosphatase [Geovibrio thiophilus]|uniref:HAD family phosphatase n=1 Tax=Geovibrio thiophilus TaxID=139438 RepID=A0A410JXC4_9BACT|nr:HAD-IA family hydrolase [Geovibrio thiophilus]QAR32813.1 HAD family phosphatase [Geovibrio thiophilus]